MRKTCLTEAVVVITQEQTLCTRVAKADLEEGVGKCEVANASHFGILSKFRVDVEEHRHINLLARPEPLLLKAEALDLIEILPGLLWRHVVG